MMLKAILAIAALAAMLTLTVVSEAKPRLQPVEQDDELYEDERTSDQ